MIVADTCLLFHLFNETNLTKIAQEVLDKDPHWIMPTLWREEYANVLSKLARKENHSVAEVITHFNDTYEALKHCEFNINITRSLELAIEHKISVYDAHFIALATEFEVYLVTEDQEIIKKCPHIALNLSDFLTLN